MRNSINNLKNYRILSIFFLIITVFFACKKNEELVRFSTDLAVNNKIIRLSDAENSTKILVYSDNNWSVSLKEGSDWVSLDKTTGKGKDYFTASVSSNNGQPARSTEIYISAKDKIDTIVLQQTGIVETLSFTDRSINTLSRVSSAKTLLNTNIAYSAIQKDIKYTTPNQNNWISNINFDGTYLSFNVAKNESPEERNAVLTLSYLDVLGSIKKDSLLISQNPKAEYDDAILKDFNYVKNSIAEGVINENIAIEGIVLADKGNWNLALNPNSATNPHVIDKTENAITVYIQSLDGTSGLRIRTKTPGDNLFNRNEKVKIWLKGTNLSKTTNPSTSTISGFPSINIIEKDPNPAPLIIREKNMRDLTDNDIYTYVKLKDVEISVPFGTYYNTNYGYYARVDCYPVNIRDINGSSMYMMINDQNAGVTPFKSLLRVGQAVPQGSGNISGVVVHENYSRYGGDMGKYAIRPTALSEIQLNQSRNSGFSTVLVEWEKYLIDYKTSPTASKNPMSPTIGEGQLGHSSLTATNYTSIAGTSGYNGLYAQGSGTNADKGVIDNEGWTFTSSGSSKWWNDSKNRGEAWLVNFSTENITKPLSMQVEGNSSFGGPRNFVVEWSTTRDMDSGNWNYITEYTMQDLVDWTNTLTTQVPGFKVMNFNLPTALLGKSTVYIRLQMKDKIVGSSTGDTNGNFANNQASRLGHISVKYNK